MATLSVPGNELTKRVTTGRLYFKPTPAGGPATPPEIDLGNVAKWKRTNKTDTVEHMSSAGGVRLVDATHVHTLAFGYLFTLDEFTAIVLELLQKADPGATVTVAAAAAASTVTFTDVLQGKTYAIGKFNVALESVKVGAVVKTGYSFNAATGRITIVPGGDIADADDVIVTYNSPAASFTRHTSGTTPRRAGTFTFVESDQYSDTPRAVHTWSGSMWINEDAEQSAEAYGTLDLNCSCHTPPVIDERQN